MCKLYSIFKLILANIQTGYICGYFPSRFNDFYYFGSLIFCRILHVLRFRILVDFDPLLKIRCVTEFA